MYKLMLKVEFENYMEEDEENSKVINEQKADDFKKYRMALEEIIGEDFDKKPSVVSFKIVNDAGEVFVNWEKTIDN